MSKSHHTNHHLGVHNSLVFQIRLKPPHGDNHIRSFLLLLSTVENQPLIGGPEEGNTAYENFWGSFGTRSPEVFRLKKNIDGLIFWLGKWSSTAHLLIIKPSPVDFSLEAVENSTSFQDQ